MKEFRIIYFDKTGKEIKKIETCWCSCESWNIASIQALTDTIKRFHKEYKIEYREM